MMLRNYLPLQRIDIFTDGTRAVMGEISDACAEIKAGVQNYTNSHCIIH